MRTVAIINQKGGCGKTTTSINLAACMARLGHKTLLVDMDPQGHCAVGLAVPEEQVERTIYEALIDAKDGKTASISEIVWQIASDFDLAPSNIRLAAFEQVFAGRDGRDDRLKRALASVADSYEWCIIDCPPSVGLLTFNALRAADEVIVPVETGFFSLHGLTKMMETLEIMKERCTNEINVRVLPTLYDTRTKLAREVLSELKSKFREYLMESTVNFNTKLKEAASFGQPITEYDPGSRGYKDFINLARELMGHKPLEVEAVPRESLSRPAELVQRAKQLAQLTNLQFGRGSATMTGMNGHPNGHANGYSMNGSATMIAPVSKPVVQPMVQPTVAPSAPSPVAPVPSHPVMLPPVGPSRFNEVPEPMAPAPRIAEIEAMMPVEPHRPEPISPVQKTTDEKLEAFYGVRKDGDDVLFAAHFDEAKKVLIAGDFNNWMPMSTPMAADVRSGVWQTRLPLAPGRYRYRLVVDGQWVTDPNNQYVETNQFGELNNIVEVF